MLTRLGSFMKKCRPVKFSENWAHDSSNEKTITNGVSPITFKSFDHGPAYRLHFSLPPLFSAIFLFIQLPSYSAVCPCLSVQPLFLLAVSGEHNPSQRWFFFTVLIILSSMWNSTLSLKTSKQPRFKISLSTDEIKERIWWNRYHHRPKMDSIITSALEEICFHGQGGISLSSLCSKLDIPPPLISPLWKNLLSIPTLRFKARNAEFFSPSDDSIQCAEDAEKFEIKILADEKLRNNFVGLYDENVQISSQQRRTLERLAIARFAFVNYLDFLFKILEVICVFLWWIARMALKFTYSWVSKTILHSNCVRQTNNYAYCSD